MKKLDPCDFFRAYIIIQQQRQQQQQQWKISVKTFFGNMTHYYKRWKLEKGECDENLPDISCIYAK